MATKPDIFSTVTLSVETPENLRKMLANSSEFMKLWLEQFHQAKEMYTKMGYEIISDNWQTGQFSARKTFNTSSSDA